MLAAEYFDALYATDSDPWRFKTRWYEIRKRALMLAALPKQYYRRAFEPGCSNGEFTAALIERCEHIYACDISGYVVNETRDRFAANKQVTIAQAAIPLDWPQQRFDLIVFNEIGYYLSLGELHKTIARIVDSLESEGAVLVCHWRGLLNDSEVDGEFVHDAFAQCPALLRQIHYREDEFLLDVFTLRNPEQYEARH